MQNLMFYWPCIIVYQYNDSNVIHLSFSLLRIKGLFMFRALLAHPQEALHKRHLVYCVRIMSVGCCHGCSQSATVQQPPEDEQVMLERCRGLWFSTNWMKSKSRWFHYSVLKYAEYLLGCCIMAWSGQKRVSCRRLRVSPNKSIFSLLLSV
jgi:hypothetical protein